MLLHAAAKLPTPRARTAAALLGVAAAAAAFVLGYGVWAEAADIACHGGYECPF